MIISNLLTFVADFKLTDELKSAVDEAKRKFEAATSKLDVDYIIFEKLGKDCIKLNKLSPDSFMQLAFQVGADVAVLSSWLLLSSVASFFSMIHFVTDLFL